ncbi:MAG TPA: NAD(P)-dependent oxidoreductase [Gemmatimonadales bacterium]|nr:NAD(P)-dependent oxidoreductase [Gemmatimonadales bacterium]
MPDNDPGSKPRLGFIGLGGMGSRMARRLLAAGYDLTVHDRAGERARPLEQSGAKFAQTPKQVAAAVDVVLTSLSDDAALGEVMFGPEGALTVARPGTIFIEMSTVSPRTSLQLHAAAASRALLVLDAPVSGSTPLAEEGQLVIIVGGKEEVYKQCLPILNWLGKEVVYMGPAGSGTATKLCLNTLLGVGLQALAEAITLGLRSGLDQQRLLQVLGDIAALSPSQKSKLEHARTGAYPVTFPLRLMYKDFSLISQRALELSVAMPSTAAAAQVCAIEHAWHEAQGDEDFSAVIRTAQQMAGLVEGVTGTEVAA